MRLAYFRTSTVTQSVESQRQAMGGPFDREFVDEGISGAVAARDRPAFRAMLAMVRPGDSLAVYAIDRLGRDAIDVQVTVRQLVGAGVTVDVLGVGPIAGLAGQLVLAILATFAEAERTRIAERTAAGTVAARRALAATGRTHNGKAAIGRPGAADPAAVVAWRRDHQASAADAATHFKIGVSTVKRYCAAAPQEAAPAALSRPAD